MTKLTDSEWKVMEILWAGNGMQLGQIMEALPAESRWSRTTVHTYLTRMMAKGLVSAEGDIPRLYYAGISREQCVNQQRKDLVNRVYHGSAGKLVLSFVKDGSLTQEEREELRRLLDEMEV